MGNKSNKQIIKKAAKDALKFLDSKEGEIYLDGFRKGYDIGFLRGIKEGSLSEQIDNLRNVIDKNRQEFDDAYKEYKLYEEQLKINLKKIKEGLK